MTIEEFQKKFGIIGKSSEIRDLVDVVMQVAPSDISVLIYGESGTGKEVFAAAIHGFSKRSSKPIISVNCGAIPEGILESELFGHKKGSFTGASDSRKGYFELADGGTLFLDEIAEMPVTTQVKLLRAIETKEFMPVGAETVSKVDVRIIAATNKDLQNEVDAKRFRQDLYFRLKAVSLQMPPLRKRRKDIPELAQHFLALFQEKNNMPRLRISNDALDLLLRYSWPGNIRELKNTVETAAALARTPLITTDDLYPLIKIDQNESENRNLPVSLGRSSAELDREFIIRALFEIKRDIMDLKHLLESRGAGLDEVSSKELISMNDVEKETIAKTLKRTMWNKRMAAKILGISERTLYRKITDYGIKPE
jgi:DNA-binding NtrC family response regulator